MFLERRDLTPVIDDQTGHEARVPYTAECILMVAKSVSLQEVDAPGQR
jgi:hypothetical protein